MTTSVMLWIAAGIAAGSWVRIAAARKAARRTGGSYWKGYAVTWDRERLGGIPAGLLSLLIFALLVVGTFALVLVGNG